VCQHSLQLKTASLANCSLARIIGLPNHPKLTPNQNQYQKQKKSESTHISPHHTHIHTYTHTHIHTYNVRDVSSTLATMKHTHTLTNTILGEQFARTRDGDRLFYLQDDALREEALSSLLSDGLCVCVCVCACVFLTRISMSTLLAPSTYPFVHTPPTPFPAFFIF
jgi:hypothetical protein